MGDFNINLLNFESHAHNHEFINNLGVYCFQPHITQPTKFTLIQLIIKQLVGTYLVT